MNTSKEMQTIFVKRYPSSSYVTVQSLTTSKVAPGMCAIYIIEYKTPVYHDLKDNVTFWCGARKYHTIEIFSKKDTPVLKTFIIKIEPTCRTEHYASEEDRVSMRRAEALNFSIDFGPALIGDEVKMSFVIKNVGSYGKFFFMTEREWNEREVTVHILFLHLL